MPFLFAFRKSPYFLQRRPSRSRNLHQHGYPSQPGIPRSKWSSQVRSRLRGACADYLKCHLIWPLHLSDLQPLVNYAQGKQTSVKIVILCPPPQDVMMMAMADVSGTLSESVGKAQTQSCGTALLYRRQERETIPLEKAVSADKS
jgi:hypothetical protein